MNKTPAEKLREHLWQAHILAEMMMEDNKLSEEDQKLLESIQDNAYSHIVDLDKVLDNKY